MSDNPLFDASYARLFGNNVTISESSDPFFEAFYDHFLADTEINDFFRETDLQRQISMLRRSFFQLVGFYVSCEPSAELQRIATVHNRLGVDPGHYDRWLDAIVETVREQDPECDETTELAWRLALTPGITYLKLSAKLATLPPP